MQWKKDLGQNWKMAQNTRENGKYKYKLMTFDMVLGEWEQM